MKTRVYVDGFNLYYGCLKGSTERWLDIAELCRRVLPAGSQVDHIRYFTARVAARQASAAGATSRSRQEVYLRALRTTPNLSIHFGQFLSHPTRMASANPPPATVAVIKTEEKGSDVNLASWLLLDAFMGKYDQAAVITNDSDLATPIDMVAKQLGKKTILLAPTANPNRRLSKELKSVCPAIRSIRRSALRAAQFPDPIQAATPITKPAKWSGRS